MDKLLAGVGIVLGAIVIAFLLSGLTAVVVMLLWDWLMPEIFHLKEITFWQAWGLTFLCHILFKTSVTTKKD